jgi:ribosomal protein S6--L-glutamate ligase
VGGAPVIIKLLEGTQGLGVVLAESAKAAQSVIEAFHNLKARIIVQEFIAESKGADLRAFVVDGEIVGAMKRQGLEGEFRSNLHRGGVGTLVKLSRAEKAAALLATKALGLGIAGVDMLQSKRGPLVLEVNSSPGLEGIEKATKQDIAWPHRRVHHQFGGQEKSQSQNQEHWPRRRRTVGTCPGRK